MNTKHQQDIPEIDQLIVGIGVTFLMAKDHIAAAKILMDQGKSKQGYIHLINTIEEIGKIIFYSKCLKSGSIERESAWDNCRKSVHDHKAKLSEFFNFIDKLKNLETKGVTCTFEIKIKNPAVQDQIDRLVLAHREGKLVSLLHSLRQLATYTVINNQTVPSPGQSILEIPPEILEASIGLFDSIFIGLDKLFFEIFGPAYSQLKDHFSSNKEKVSYGRLKETLAGVPAAFLEIVHRLQKNASALKNDPLIKKLPDESDQNMRTIFALIFILKNAVKLSAGRETINSLIPLPPE